ncbi:hypothetical protein VTK56DRAFT_1824 [Thermocarpiscus australiensis]
MNSVPANDPVPPTPRGRKRELEQPSLEAGPALHVSQNKRPRPEINENNMRNMRNNVPPRPNLGMESQSHTPASRPEQTSDSPYDVMTPVPGWNNYLTYCSSGQCSGPVPIPDVIRPPQFLGVIPSQLPQPPEVQRPQVLVHAPGCTPEAATGVDRFGVWYSGRHNVCPIRARHRHDWDGAVYFANLSDVFDSHIAMRAIDQNVLQREHDETVRSTARFMQHRTMTAGLPAVPVIFQPAVAQQHQPSASAYQLSAPGHVPTAPTSMGYQAHAHGSLYQPAGVPGIGEAASTQQHPPPYQLPASGYIPTAQPSIGCQAQDWVSPNQATGVQAPNFGLPASGLITPSQLLQPQTPNNTPPVPAALPAEQPQLELTLSPLQPAESTDSDQGGDPGWPDFGLTDEHLATIFPDIHDYDFWATNSN